MKGDQVKFSIIVPIYNIAVYLNKCVDSILQQDYADFEVILVDDGSTDDCPVMCDRYKAQDERVVVVHKKNGGLVSARKAGVAIASGDYAICVDGDDWVAENFLSEIFQIIKQTQADIICYGYYEVNGDSLVDKHINLPEGYYGREKIASDILPCLIHDINGHSFPPTIWNRAYRMALYREEQLAVNDRIKIGEDAACSYPCVARADDLYIIHKPLYYYRRNVLSMTKNRKPFSWDGPALIDAHHRARIRITEYSMQEQISRRSIHALLNVIKTQFYRNENYFTIAKEVKQELCRPDYKTIINSCRFKKGTLFSILHFCLRHRIVFPVYVLSKIR